MTWPISKPPGSSVPDAQKNRLKLKRYSMITPSAQSDARMSVKVMYGWTSPLRTTLATITNIIA